MDTFKIVIGLLGKSRSGKSTLAKYLVETFGAERLAFADPLKEMLSDLYGFSDAQLYGDEKDIVDARWGVTPRSCMMSLGESARQRLGDRVWADACLRRIEASPNYNGLFVIDDVRHLSEVGAIAEAYGLDVNNLHRAHIIKLVNTFDDSRANQNHPSESEVDDVPPDHIAATIRNNRTPRVFDQLDVIVKNLMPPVRFVYHKAPADVKLGLHLALRHFPEHRPAFEEFCIFLYDRSIPIDEVYFAALQPDMLNEAAMEGYNVVIADPSCKRWMDVAALYGYIKNKGLCWDDICTLAGVPLTGRTL